MSHLLTPAKLLRTIETLAGSCILIALQQIAKESLVMFVLAFKQTFGNL